MLNENQLKVVREAIACGIFALAPDREELTKQMEFVSSMEDSELMTFIEPWRVAKIAEIEEKIVCMNNKLTLLKSLDTE